MFVRFICGDISLHLLRAVCVSAVNFPQLPLNSLPMALFSLETYGELEPHLHQEWLLTNGSMKNGMPSWSRLPEQQRWQIVSFLKSLQ